MTEAVTESPNGSVALLATETVSVAPTDELTVGTKVRIANPARTESGGYVSSDAFGKVGEIKTDYSGRANRVDGWYVEFDTPYGPDGQYIGARYLTPLSETDILREEMATLRQHVETLESERDTFKEQTTARARELEEFKERVREVGYRYAEDNDLCRVFDQCMEEIGLPGREREFTVCVDAHVHVHVDVTASSADEAAERVDARMISTAIQNQGRYLEISDFDIGETE